MEENINIQELPKRKRILYSISSAITEGENAAIVHYCEAQKIKNKSDLIRILLVNAGILQEKKE